MVILTATKRLKGENNYTKKHNYNKPQYDDFEYVIRSFIKYTLHMLSPRYKYEIAALDDAKTTFKYSSRIDTGLRPYREGKHILKIDSHNKESLIYCCIEELDNKENPNTNKEYKFISDKFLLNFYNYLFDKNLIKAIPTSSFDSICESIVKSFGFYDIGIQRYGDWKESLYITFYYKYDDLKKVWENKIC